MRGEANETMLMKACQHGKRDVLKMLLSRGARVNACSDDGSTALHCLSMSQSTTTQAAQPLLYHGAKVDARLDNGLVCFTSGSVEIDIDEISFFVLCHDSK